ncbi:MAG TPA: RNA polymerase sigma factor ShbA [Streptomyces sp.]
MTAVPGGGIAAGHRPAPVASEVTLGALSEPVAAAHAGDPEATEKLLAAIRPLVVRYCRARIGRAERSHISADDVAQEVCLAVLAALPAYQDQGRPFLAFVYGIAQHKVADAHRAAARNRAEPVRDLPELPAAGDEPESNAIALELNTRLNKILGMLPVQWREVVVLRVVVGLSATETADALGMTPGAVRVTQHRALSRLRPLLQAEVGTA